jgi:hypothetical protein
VNLGRLISLLNDMRQFVCNQRPPLVRLRRKPVGAEHNIVTESVGMSIQLPRRICCAATSMNTHMGKVVAKSWFEKAAGLSV